MVKLWDVNSGKTLRTLSGHVLPVTSVSFSPTGAILASASLDHQVKLWEVSSGKLLKSLEGHLGPVHCVAFAPNGKYLVAIGTAERLQFWDIESAETFLYCYSFGVDSWLALLPDGRFDASQEGIRHLGYSESGTFDYYSAESLVKEFYDPPAVQSMLAKYT